MSDTPGKPQRRIVMPERKTQVQLKVDPFAISVEGILNDALQTAAFEVAQYRVKAGAGKLLDAKEARTLQGWIETLVKLKKEQRDTERSQELDKLSEEELVALAKKVLNNQPDMIELPPNDDEND